MSIWLQWSALFLGDFPANFHSFDARFWPLVNCFIYLPGLRLMLLGSNLFLLNLWTSLEVYVMSPAVRLMSSCTFSSYCRAHFHRTQCIKRPHSVFCCVLLLVTHCCYNTLSISLWHPLRPTMYLLACAAWSYVCWGSSLTLEWGWKLSYGNKDWNSCFCK